MATSYGTQNTFLTPDVIAREALLILEDNIVAPQMMSTSATADFTGAKVGDTIRIRRPAFFGVDEFDRTGGNINNTVTIQDAVENSVNLQIEKHFDVSFEVSSKELAFAVDDFNERLLKPAMSALAQKIDQYALTKIANLGGLFGVATTYAAPSSLTHVASIVEKMNNQNIPMTNRKFLVSPAMQTALYGIDEFVRADIRGAATSPVEEASLGRFMGLDTVMSQNLPKHSTLGTAATTGSTDVVYTTAAAYTEGATTINIAGGPAGTLTIVAGDTLAIDYVDGVTREHVVTNSNAFSTNAITGVQITPGLYGVSGATAVSAGVPNVVASGATVRNVTSTLVADRTTTAATPVGSYTMGAAFHPSAFQLVFVPQPNPMGPGTSSSTVNYNGMSLRVLQSYDHIKKRDLISVDCLVGAAAVDGRLGVRVASVNG
jgi:hypothetical protein